MEIYGKREKRNATYKETRSLFLGVSLHCCPLRSAAMQSLQSPPLCATALGHLRPKSDNNAPSTAAFRPFCRTTLPNITAAGSPAVSAPKRETDPKKRVVITGMGLVSVFSSDVDVFYDKLLAGESGIGPIDRFDPSEFPTRFAGQIRGFTSTGYIDRKNDRMLDDCLRYCIVAGKKAIEDADLGGRRLSKVLSSPLMHDLSALRLSILLQLVGL